MFTIDGIKFTSLEQFSKAVSLRRYGLMLRRINDKRLSEESIALFLLGEKELKGIMRERHLVLYKNKKVSPIAVIKELDIELKTLCSLLESGVSYNEIRLEKQIREKAGKPFLSLKTKKAKEETTEIPVEQLRLGKHVLTTHEYNELLKVLKSMRKAETTFVNTMNKKSNEKIDADPLV